MGLDSIDIFKEALWSEQRAPITKPNMITPSNIIRLIALLALLCAAPVQINGVRLHRFWKIEN